MLLDWLRTLSKHMCKLLWNIILLSINARSSDNYRRNTYSEYFHRISFSTAFLTGLRYLKDKWCEVSFQRNCYNMIINVVFKSNVHWIRFSLMSWQGRFHLHTLMKMTKYIWRIMVLYFWILSLKSVYLLPSGKIKMKNYLVFINFGSLILIDYAWRCGFSTWHV